MKTALDIFRKDEDGSTIVEAAILLPLIITMLVGVFQAGTYLQAQNAVRSLSGEMSRYMAIEAQKNNYLTNEQIEVKAYSLAVTAPYMLQSSDLEVYVNDEETQSMDRVRKVDVNLVYEVPNYIGIIDIPILTLDYTRSVFLPGPDLEDPEPDDGTDPGTGEEPVFGT